MSETAPNLPSHQFLRQLVANGCTAANMALGLISILCSSHGQLHYAALALLASVLFDALDGHLARLLGVASEFGVQLDSLADMTSFVTAGSVLSFYWFQGQCPVWILVLVAVLYLVMGGSRLARFNTGTKASDEFEGMPTTAMAVLLAMAYLNDANLAAWIGVPAVAIGAVLMVSHFPYPKFNKVMRLPKLIWPVLIGYAAIQPHHPAAPPMAIRTPVLGIIQSKQPSGHLVWNCERCRASKSLTPLAPGGLSGLASPDPLAVLEGADHHFFNKNRCSAQGYSASRRHFAADCFVEGLLRRGVWSVAPGIEQIVTIAVEIQNASDV